MYSVSLGALLGLHVAEDMSLLYLNDSILKNNSSNNIIIYNDLKSYCLMSKMEDTFLSPLPLVPPVALS